MKNILRDRVLHEGQEIEDNRDLRPGDVGYEPPADIFAGVSAEEYPHISRRRPRRRRRQE